jgi:hypothetical protein
MHLTKQIRFAALRWAVLLASPLWVHAQTDTVFTTIRTQTSEAADEEARRYETERDRLFGTQVPSRWMLSVHRNFGQYDVLNSKFFQSTQIGGEVKLSTEFSVGAAWSLGFLPNSDEDFDMRRQSVQLEGRWYHGLARRVKSGTQANNFSANYVGLSQTLARQESGRFQQNTYSLQARYGVQRRWLNHGFFDFSVGVGFTSYLASSVQPRGTTLQFSQNLRVGLAQFQRSKTPTQQDGGGYCTVLRCFDEERSMLKINLLGSVNVLNTTSSVLIPTWTVSVRPNVAYERKLGNSPFSVELATALGIGRGQVRWGYLGLPNRVWLLNGQIDGELRWYYSQRRRIAEGRSGNNLSGPFAALHAGYRYEYVNMQADNGDITSDRRGTSGHVVWGYQQRIFRRGYAQFRFGLGVGDIGTDTKWEFSTYGGMNVGFAF